MFSKTSGRLLLAAGICAGLSWLPAPTSQRRGPLAPIASFAATLQWARSDAAFNRGRLDVGLARAERALKLDPDATAGWSWLASVLVHRFGGTEFEASPTARRTWVEAGLAVLARGEEVAAEPEELAFHAGLVMAFVASLPEETLEWPGGSDAAWTEAAQHFERARDLGHPRADDAAQAAWREFHWPEPSQEETRKGPFGGPRSKDQQPLDED